MLASTNVYGLLVSPDMKSALIKGTLNEGQLDYGKVFEEIQAIRAEEAAPGVHIHATGHPVLVGWVDSYSGDILLIFFYTILIVPGYPGLLLAPPCTASCCRCSA